MATNDNNNDNNNNDNNVPKLPYCISIPSVVVWSTTASDLPFHRACQEGNIELVKNILAETGDSILKIADFTYSYPIMWAAAKGQTTIVEYLINMGDSPFTFVTPNYITPLFLACVGNHYDTVEFLLKNGGNKISHSTWANPLMAAAFYGYCEVAKLLLDNNESAYSSNRATPLHIACAKGYKDMVTLLLDHGIYIDVVDSNNATPLIYAFSRPDIVELLLNRGATPAKYHKKAFAFAINYQDLPLVTWLVENGTNMNDEDLKTGMTALGHAIKCRDYDIVKYLLENGADPNAGEVFPLMALVKKQNGLHAKDVELVRILIDNGANINQVYKSKTTPLVHYLKKHFFHAARVMIECGMAKFPHPDIDIPTPLHLVDSLDLAELLVENGANVNAIASITRTEPRTHIEQKHRLTPLHVAMFNGNQPLISYLLEKGAKYELVDTNKDILTIWQYANSEKIMKIQGDTWTTRDHWRQPKRVSDAVKMIMWINKIRGWNLDIAILSKIFSFIAYDVNKPKPKKRKPVVFVDDEDL